MNSYFNFQFRNIGDHASFTTKLFKLTRTLLSKYKDISSFQKVPLH